MLIRPDLNPNEVARQMIGCAGQMSLIHEGPTALLTTPKGSTATFPVPDTRAHSQKSWGVMLQALIEEHLGDVVSEMISCNNISSDTFRNVRCYRTQCVNKCCKVRGCPLALIYI